MTTKANFKKIYRIIFVLIALYGVLGHYIQIVIDRAPESTFLGATIDYFSYFTIQSNWLVVVWWIVAIFSVASTTQRWFLSPRVKGALTAYITVTFLVYAVVLDKMFDPAGFNLAYVNISHYITPLAFILDWLLFEQRGVYQWRFIPGWLLYPVAYFIYALVYGTIIDKALYPFFNYNKLGWGGMIFQVAILLVFFLVLASLYIGINRLLARWFPPAVES